MATVHILGGGISGLAAATMLAEKHIPVKIYEATAHAGGRCRSGRDGDHGLHSIGARDHEIRAYLKRIGAGESLVRAARPPFPAAPVADYLPLLKFLWSRYGTADAQLACTSYLRDTWLHPFARTMLGTRPENLPVRGLRRFMLRQRFGKRYVATQSLQASFVQPALEFLDFHGGSIYFSHALTSIECSGDALKTLIFPRKKIALMEGDIVILATPPGFTRSILPDIAVPAAQHSAITLHYHTDHREAPGLHYPIDAPMDLLRYRDGVISASIRIADHAWHSDEALLAQRLWRALLARHPYLPPLMPGYTMAREKRAGHALQDARPTPINYGQILLAGDWLDPLSPASLEAAAASGHAAAALAITKLPPKPQHSQNQQRFYLN